MKISKSRLLQIIREEVELREKTIEENTFELDEEDLSDEEEKQAIDDEIDIDKALGNLEEVELEEESTQEDKLFTVKQPRKEIPAKNDRNKLEIKIR